MPYCFRCGRSRELYRRGLDIQFRYRFYDALIIAAALEASCTRLLSDLRHGQTIENLTIENPFLDSPIPNRARR